MLKTFKYISAIKVINLLAFACFVFLFNVSFAKDLSQESSPISSKTSSSELKNSPRKKKKNPAKSFNNQRRDSKQDNSKLMNPQQKKFRQNESSKKAADSVRNQSNSSDTAKNTNVSKKKLSQNSENKNKLKSQNQQTQKDSGPFPDLKPLIGSRTVFEKTNDTITPLNEIDRIILKNLKVYHLKPAVLCSDAVFLRRVYIDLIGTVPDPQEARAFLNDQTENKRAILIDRLLNEDRFVDYWSMKWCDLLKVKSEFPINLWPNGVAAYHRWIQKAIRENMPYDHFAKILLTSDGSNFRCGPANFYRACQNRDPVSLAESAAQVFLGFQLAPMPKEKQEQMAKFFTRISYKGSAQWKEEIVYWNRKPLDSPDVVFPDGSQGSVAAGQDPRSVFADWLIQPGNKAFNNNIVNRIWFWIFQRGIVHEPDDFRADNPPCCPGLLEYLSNELVQNKYDLKHIYRLIFNSRTYQQSSITDNDYQDAEKYFAVYPVKRIEAEVLQDIFIKIFHLQLTYMSEVPEPYSFLPDRLQTVELSDAGITNSFLEMFGRSTRDTGLETDRNNDVTASQQLFFINSNEINNWVKKMSQQFGKMRQLVNAENMKSGKKYDPAAGIDNIWLTLLSRFPSNQEREYYRQIMKLSKNAAQSQEDCIWSIVNGKEFLCRH